jgi:A/G-specific adenine glycosylase
MSDLQTLVPKLMDWWDAGHAELPWRHTSDPYSIWVAEIMLQQTQIKTVIPYYERWLARFPTVQALAKASLDEVLTLWQGLGYYSRARNLLAAARMVVEDFEGQIPPEVSDLQQLPGIGRYTAGAIASIAFDKQVPVLDGNVIRLFSRLIDLEKDITLSKTKRELWDLAAVLVPFERAGDYNQALMEMGQRICLPAAPLCHQCPLAGICLAQSRGTQLERPVRPPRKRTPHYDVTAAVIQRPDGRILISRRPLDGLLGGLWEFPGGKKEDGESLPAALRREIREELDLTIEVEAKITTIQHAYTHFRITLHAYHARYLGGQPKHLGVSDHAWVTLEAMEDYAFAVTDRKIMACLRAESGMQKQESLEKLT